MKTKSLLYIFLFTHLTVYSADSAIDRNFFNMGMSYLYKNNYSAAADYFGQAADLNKNDIWARYYYVYSIALLGRKNEALKWLPKLSSISKTPHYKKLMALLDSGTPKKNNEPTQKSKKAESKNQSKIKKTNPLEEAEYYIDLGENEKALSIIRDYKKKNPTDRKVYRLLAIIDFNNSDYQASIDNFEVAFQEGVNDFDSYFIAAQASLNIQNYDAALNYYEKASQLTPKDLFVKISLAELYCDRSDYDNSARIFNEILNDTPDYPDARIGLAKIEFKKGFIEEALKLVTNSINQNPDNAKAHYLKSQILLEQKDYDNALKEAELAYSYNVSNMEYRVFLSTVKIRNFKIKEAIDDLKKVLQIFPDNPYALTALGEAQLTEEKIQEGKATLLKSESIKKMPQTALLLALIECNNKDYDKAEEFYKEYCSLSGNSPEALLEYAYFTELKDNQKECLKAYNAISEKYPGTPFAAKAMQRANEIKKSNYQKSREEYGIY